MRKALLAAALLISQLPNLARADSADVVAVQKALERGIEVWVVAQRTLDSMPLRTWFRDQALADLEHDLASSRENQAFLSFQAPLVTYDRIAVDGELGQAWIETTEIWQYSAHQVGSGECLFRAGPNTVRSTYHLKRGQEGWQVVSTISQTQGERAPIRSCVSGKPAPQK